MGTSTLNVTSQNKKKCEFRHDIGVEWVKLERNYQTRPRRDSCIIYVDRSYNSPLTTIKKKISNLAPLEQPSSGTSKVKRLES